MRSILYTLLVVANIACLGGCQDVRTVSVDVGDQIRIEYSVLWGLGVEQRIRLYRGSRLLAEAAEDVWKKPYHAGGPIFVTADGTNYYVILYSGVYHIDLPAQNILNICQIEKDLLEELEFLGRFGLTEIKSSTRGDDVTFTPADKTAPERTGDVNWSVLEGRCG